MLFQWTLLVLSGAGSQGARSPIFQEGAVNQEAGDYWYSVCVCVCVCICGIRLQTIVNLIF